MHRKKIITTLILKVSSFEYLLLSDYQEKEGLKKGGGGAGMLRGMLRYFSTEVLPGDYFSKKFTLYSLPFDIIFKKFNTDKL